MTVPSGQVHLDSGSATDDSEAVRLFTERARRVRSTFPLEREHEHVIRLCQLVQGLPLALELAAGWTRAMTCDAILREVQQNLDFLALHVQDVPERHRSMRAVMDYSWELLSAEEKGVLQGLSVLRGGFTAEAAARVARASLPVLGKLVDRSLLTFDPEAGRYDMHEFVRQFAEDQLLAAGNHEAVQAAHAAYFVAFVAHTWERMTNGPQLEAIREFEIELPNVRVAWRCLVDHRRFDALETCIEPLWFYFNLRDQPRQAIELFEDATNHLASNEPNGEPNARRESTIAHLLARQGYCYTHWQSSERGERMILNALDRLRHIDAPRVSIAALQSLAHAYLYSNRLTEMKDAILKAFRLATAHGGRWETLLTHYWLGLAHLAENEYEEASRIATLCLEEASVMGNLWIAAPASGVLLGTVARMQGRYEEARRRYEWGLALYADLDEVWGMAFTHEGLGSVAQAMNDRTGARQHFLTALRMRYEAGVRIEIVRPMLHLAELALVQNQLEDAILLLATAQPLMQANRLLKPVADGLIDMAQQRLGEQALHEAWEQAASRPLRDVIHEVLAQDRPERLRGDATGLSLAKINVHFGCSLTDREFEILEMLVQGYANKEIADRLFVIMNTVRTHLKHLYSKLGVESRTRAIASIHALSST